MARNFARLAWLLVLPLVASTPYCDEVNHDEYHAPAAAAPAGYHPAGGYPRGGHYGPPPAPCKKSYTPAPPGHTPTCAKPGSTYCEKASDYPLQRVSYLVQKWFYDHETLIIDETRDNFSARKPYGHHHHPHDDYFPTAPGNSSGPYPAARYPDFAYNTPVFQPQDWWNRPARDLPASFVAPPPRHGRRKKRQAPQGTTLCPTTQRFVTPEAAMGTDGNWYYTVDMEGTQYTQQVLAEECATQQCDGLCGLPGGYTSRCVQKYVQKRLVSINGNGRNLNSQTFWFPHCCVCEFSPT